MSRPLEGIRVADFSHVFAGPIASYFLALLGAEVIKVEAPGTGDGMRNYGGDARYFGMSPHFMGANAGKKSLAVDLKHPEGNAVARRLIASCDVVVENLRPGAMRKMGLGYDAARELKSDIIYCSISGYGQTGPKRDFPAIDNIVQATSGMIALTEDEGSPGEVVPFPVVDTYTATQAALGILAAIIQRGKTGTSQYIDCAMLDSTMALLAPVIVPYLATGVERNRRTAGKRGYSNSPASGVFETLGGGAVSLGAVRDALFQRLCVTIGRQDLADDPRYASALSRMQHADALVPELAATFRTRLAEDWERELNAVGVPCGAIRRLSAAVAEPELRERGVISEIDVAGLPVEGPVSVVGLGFGFEHDGPAVSASAPWLGEQSDEILASLGYSESEAERLVQEGAIARKKG